ncbi:MAG: Nif11-like leader peptide family natural product precursor [Planctomycetota bacterium]
MSVKNVTAFFEKLETDKALQAKVRALGEKRKKQDEATLAELAKIAKAAGLGFTPAEYAQARKKAAGELSEEQLKAVAGGQGCQAGLGADASRCRAGLGFDISAACSKGIGAY